MPVVRKAVDANPPRAVGGSRPLKLYYATQVRVAPPTIRPVREQSPTACAGIRTLSLARAPRRLRLRRQPDPTAGAKERMIPPLLWARGAWPPASCWVPFPSGSGGGSSSAGSTSASTGAGISARRMSFGFWARSTASPCLLLDAGKGAVAVLLALRLGPDTALPLAVGLCAILGHLFSPWVRFRGGKGVATALGVWMRDRPPRRPPLRWAFGALRFGLARRVSVASLLAALALPIAVSVTGPWRAVAPDRGRRSVGLLVWIRHRGNIRRLVRREEPPLWGR